MQWGMLRDLVSGLLVLERGTQVYQMAYREPAKHSSDQPHIATHCCHEEPALGTLFQYFV